MISESKIRQAMDIIHPTGFAVSAEAIEEAHKLLREALGDSDDDYGCDICGDEHSTAEHES